MRTKGAPWCAQNWLRGCAFMHDATAPKRPVNMSLNSDLVAQARAAKLNLSALTEEAIAAALA
ncbi:MAG TPA: type II toxin-antitoxin system CcdA family antitoxin, partial [Rhodopila sp.]|nr:type II toxin-antitoxin system CcdA family antitoxin [Rhodopila sp.]